MPLMTTTTAAAAPVLLVDVEDLADADLRDELDERLDVGGRLLRADALALAVAVRREARAAVAAHGLGSRAALLVD
jgi:hypothetical protein